MAWYYAQVPIKQTANMGNIQEAFLTAYTAAGCPENMAMFAGDLDDDGTALYFSPATANHALGGALLRSLMAVQCERPPRGLTFLIGQEHTRLRYIAGQL
jgi:hypothetical protein